MNSQEKFEARVTHLLDQESCEPETWFWLSFADEKGFKGVAIVRGRGIISAVKEARRVNANPGGEVLAMRIPEESGFEPRPGEANRLLTREEAESINEREMAKGNK